MSDPRNRMTGTRMWYDPVPNVSPVVPSDSVDLTEAPRWLMFTAPGNVSILTWGGQTVVIPVVAGDMLGNILVRRVNATGTTANGILMGWG